MDEWINKQINKMKRKGYKTLHLTKSLLFNIYFKYPLLS